MSVMVRRLRFLVAFYLLLDVGNPMMPGALVLNADESVEACAALRLPVDDVAATCAAASSRCRETVGESPIPMTPALRAVRPLRLYAPRRRLRRRIASPCPEED